MHAHPAQATAAGPQLTLQQVAHIEPMLVHYALRAVRHEELARDLVQETWAAALTSLHRFQGRSTLRTWMVGILRRKIVDHRRRQRDTASFAEEQHGRGETSNHEARIDFEAAAQAVGEHLSTLPQLEREAVSLCDVEDVARGDAARQLGVTDGHLRVLLHRGRSKLRHSLSAEGHSVH